MGIFAAGKKAGDQVLDEMTRQWADSRRRLQILSEEHKQLDDIKNKIQVLSFSGSNRIKRLINLLL